ncbi:tetratricopeptide repeat protein [Flavobacterium sp. MFBS3-15]|uniref:hybrid sensor histidine kinase/response regulator transcription factor n=1 Tax=Flavobacterium sp. MFBS3-15 TaxID=2989816 RepID=UPI002235EAA5|nr:ATP-binding protein [Flavobacterium sp. MFBS3-15]MCW4467718.1 tetratricopeptide repeat protein [Flavobacterium sp. MFBS3-15]
MKHANELRMAQLNVEMATYYLTTSPDSSIYYAHRAIDIGRKNNNPVILIRSYAKIGEAYQKQNKMKEAISNYLKGLELAEKHNEKSLAGTIYNGIGVCYFYQNNPKKAEQYLKLAAEAKKDANDYQYYAIISINLAVLQISTQSPKEAVKTLMDAERTLLKNKQPEYLATVYNSLGAAYQEIKPDSCLYFYEKCIALADKYNDLTNQMTANQNIGDYYFARHDYPSAIRYMKKAIEVNNKRSEDTYKPALYDRIGLIYEAMGDFRNAYNYKKLENEARQRIFSVQKQKEVDELEIRYQTEKKEKEIQLNKQEIERGKNQRNQLLFGAVLIFLVAGFVLYLVFQRRRIIQQFEQEKLKMFENIFHEIRTPLTLIEGPIHLMKNDSDSKFSEQLVLVERNSKRLMRLVNELLDASKLGKGSFQLHYVSGNLGKFISDIVDSFSNEAFSEDKTVIVDTEHSEGYYSFPSNVLEKILSNLIGNAIKYSPAGSEVKVTSKVHEDKLYIEVKDNGPGIPENEQKKVFRRFFRGKYSSGTNGTGIGLSLVKELVELAHGSIQMQSTPSGTAFTVTLPVKQLQNVPEAIYSDTDTPTLLLAEDDADTAAFTISVLQDSFRVIHAKNGQEAISIINENLPDIVLSDIMMPVKDGIQLLRGIRSEELYNHLPVILFSAKASLESRLQGLSHGADAYIAKPFSPDELRLTVHNLFTTMQRNKQLYQSAIKSAKTFEERIKSDNAYINKVIESIIRNIGDAEYSVNELSSDMAVSRSQLHRKLAAHTGFSTTNFIRMVRLERARDMLLANEGNISEIAYKCGFNSQSYFTKSFTEYFGESPSQFSKNQ